MYRKTIDNSNKNINKTKHMPLNSCISLNTSAYSNEDDGVGIIRNI